MLTLAISGLSLAAPHGRSLSNTQIIGYSPGSQVTDHANIDLDQAAMEKTLSSPQDWAGAEAIYTKGAHSKPTAECTIDAKGTAGVAIPKSTYVKFVNNNGDSIDTAKASSDYSKDATKISFTYPVSELRVQPATSACYEGGLKSGTSTKGCIANGQFRVTIDKVDYNYQATCTNRGKRTLQGFSTGAQAKMNDCPKDATKAYANGCPYTTYKPYYDYYGVHDYANQLVLAALKGEKTKFTNGDNDFSSASKVGNSAKARVEVAKKATAYMNAWMYVLREFEDAIDDCANGDLTANAGSSGPVHAWDEGVAFYVGSMMTPDDLTGTELPTLDDKGKLAYTLGNKRCQNFKTCGPEGDELIGEAKANLKLMDLFHAGQHKLLVGKCGDVVPIKDKINSQMTVPLVQGTLRYAYKMAALSGGDKEKGEGAVFAAAVLPQVHACSPSAAKTIYDNMHVSSGTDVKFTAVKAALEGCYSKMGITCADVGGLYNSGNKAYYKDKGFDASPCTDASTALPLPALIGIIVAGVIALLALLCACRMFMAERKGKPLFTPVGEKK